MYNPRVSGAQLPSSTELLDILKKESQRSAVRFDYVTKNILIFDAHRQLSELTGSDDDWIDDYANMTLDLLVESINKNHSELTSHILGGKENIDLYESLYESLVPAEDKSNSDVIFVFGASTNARLEKAIELYESGVAPKIILSGRGPHYVDSVSSEAERMAAVAYERGIPNGV